MLDLLDPVATPYSALQNQINGLLEDFLAEPAAWASGSELRRYPAVNIWEDGDAAHLEAELPGAVMEDVELYVAGNQIRLGVQRRVSAPEKAAWHRQERVSGNFTRTFTLPWELDADKVEAKLKDGILTVELPKAESAKPRKIKLLAN
ncbi:MAG: Hsp20/alpha crystallin family protein [Phycisphaerae bacterium]